MKMKYLKLNEMVQWFSDHDDLMEYLQDECHDDFLLVCSFLQVPYHELQRNK
jgi:hypothetical protein